ncbi:Jag family protein [Ornithinimicrobium ciconiae]|uniref:Jag family protein n=1 Tax=Ornithinimicrobium ciconiae TaxID=2594265 RepID=UPI0013FCF8FE|nr:R3H domain-containing nucleic acid-binding protein [Ornithinimicrobium ciconiae]
MTTEPITQQTAETPEGVATPTTEDSPETTTESSALQQGGSSTRKEALEHEGEIAADFLETLLDIADLDGDLEVNVEGDRAAVAIVDSEDGPAPKKLVGSGAAVLEALQELTRLAVQAETGDRSRLMLDIAGHRAGRRAELVTLARRTCETVKNSGEQAELEAMSAFERKVVHDEVLAAGLISESEGTEPNRYVVILPQD